MSTPLILPPAKPVYTIPAQTGMYPYSMPGVKATLKYSSGYESGYVYSPGYAYMYTSPVYGVSRYPELDTEYNASYVPLLIDHALHILDTGTRAICIQTTGDRMWKSSILKHMIPAATVHRTGSCKCSALPVQVLRKDIAILVHRVAGKTPSTIYTLTLASNIDKVIAIDENSKECRQALCKVNPTVAATLSGITIYLIVIGEIASITRVQKAITTLTQLADCKLPSELLALGARSITSKIPRQELLKAVLGSLSLSHSALLPTGKSYANPLPHEVLLKTSIPVGTTPVNTVSLMLETHYRCRVQTRDLVTQSDPRKFDMTIYGEWDTMIAIVKLPAIDQIDTIVRYDRLDPARSHVELSTKSNTTDPTFL